MLVETEYDNNNDNKKKKMKNCNNDISVVTYANLTALLANMHIDSDYLVVVTKEGSD